MRLDPLLIFQFSLNTISLGIRYAIWKFWVYGQTCPHPTKRVKWLPRWLLTFSVGRNLCFQLDLSFATGVRWVSYFGLRIRVDGFDWIAPTIFILLSRAWVCLVSVLIWCLNNSTPNMSLCYCRFHRDPHRFNTVLLRLPSCGAFVPPGTPGFQLQIQSDAYCPW